MKIKAVNNSTSDRNRYLGPPLSAPSRLFGNMDHGPSGQRKVTGSYAHHVIRALKLCNVDTVI